MDLFYTPEYAKMGISFLFVDNDLAFGFRMYNWKERNLGFFVSDGNFEVWNAVVLTE